LSITTRAITSGPLHRFASSTSTGNHPLPVDGATLVVLGLAVVSFDQERKKLDPDPTPGGLIG